MPVKVKMMASDLDWYLDEDGELLPHAYNETPRYIDHDRGDHSYAQTGESRKSGKENTLNKGKEKAIPGIGGPIPKRKKASFII